MSFLAQMAQGSAERVRVARAASGEAALLAACRARPAPPRLVLAGFDLIAEIKRHSPAEGALGPATDVVARARAYADAGAAAVSVLTEPERFGGSLDDLSAATRALEGSAVPVMRKDFLVDPWQVLEARAAGAGGVLLIIAMLNDVVLAEMLAAAREHGLFVLLEAFDEADLERAGPCLAGATATAPVLVGVNSRDLRTLAVDPARLARLAPRLPPGVPAVAESGLHTAADAAEAAALGYRLALVGTALMRAQDPGALVGVMLAAGRDQAREQGR
ncbi:indole-3-glycerol-phosphate synthase [Thioalkalivibrio sp. XN279]|uniref:indole-3-glycerol phosphate synthase TrpC n=1 Tax=Thioalkalivibrio sp. XN279 TaxID=2714953 RepID=UPI00197E35CB